jgi:hypothetical protein
MQVSVFLFLLFVASSSTLPFRYYLFLFLNCLLFHVLYNSNLWMFRCGNILILTIRFLDVAKFKFMETLVLICYKHRHYPSRVITTWYKKRRQENEDSTGTCYARGIVMSTFCVGSRIFSNICCLLYLTYVILI